MKIEADGFSFDFTDALDVFVFDEKDKQRPYFHGLTHAMKAVDLIVELENGYLFVEMKDFHDPEAYDFRNATTDNKQPQKEFNHLCQSLIQKYRDTWLYRWAEGKLDKPVHYVCLLTLENALISRLNKELRLRLPVGTAGPRWTQHIAASCAAVNLERWNQNFTAWPVESVA